MLITCNGMRAERYSSTQKVCLQQAIMSKRSGLVLRRVRGSAATPFTSGQTPLPERSRHASPASCPDTRRLIARLSSIDTVFRGKPIQGDGQARLHAEHAWRRSARHPNSLLHSLVVDIHCSSARSDVRMPSSATMYTLSSLLHRLYQDQGCCDV